jgi:hypothetical protein
MLKGESDYSDFIGKAKRNIDEISRKARQDDT